MSPRPIDDVLRDLVLGEDVPAAERRRVEADPEARRRLEAMRGVVSRLDALGELRRDADLRAAAGAADGADGDGGDGGPVALRAPGAGPRTARRLAPWLVGAAAALLALAGWRWLAREGGPARDGDAAAPVEYLGDTLELLAPLEGAGDYDVFRWRGELPTGGWFRVEVAAPHDASFAAPLATADDLEQTTWTPPPTATAAWPDRIRWRVVAHDALGEVSSSAWALASR